MSQQSRVAVYNSAINEALGAFSAGGIDLPAVLSRWADGYLKQLGERGAALEIQELLRAGCKAVPLAAAMRSGTFLAQLPPLYHQALGDLKRVERLSQEFEATALIFDGLAASLYPDSSENAPTPLPFPGPKQMAEHLRTYRMLLAALPQLLELTHIRNVRDFERHLPTAYVRDATGNWHDREVAALISAATATVLDEGTHRAWRNRSFENVFLPINALWQMLEMLAELRYTKPKS